MWRGKVVLMVEAVGLEVLVRVLQGERLQGLV
jgi:hypothetical protein